MLDFSPTNNCHCMINFFPFDSSLINRIWIKFRSSLCKWSWMPNCEFKSFNQNRFIFEDAFIILKVIICNSKIHGDRTSSTNFFHHKFFIWPSICASNEAKFIHNLIAFTYVLTITNFRVLFFIWSQFSIFTLKIIVAIFLDESKLPSKDTYLDLKSPITSFWKEIAI